jgi:hypothetical protein
MPKNKKWMILIGLIVLTVVGVMIMNVFDKRPFKFEDFETSESLKTFLENRYPIGSDGDIALKDLELAGAKCEVVSKNKYLPSDLKEYDYVSRCNYRTGWLYWPPGENYIVRILGDKNKKIIDFSVGKSHAFS